MNNDKVDILNVIMYLKRIQSGQMRNLGSRVASVPLLFTALQPFEQSGRWGSDTKWLHSSICSRHFNSLDHLRIKTAVYSGLYSYINLTRLQILLLAPVYQTNILALLHTLLK